MNLRLNSLSSLARNRAAVSLNPQRDWFVLLTCALLLLLASVVGNLWLFHRATEDQPIGEAGNGSAQPLDLERTRQLFSERADERARYVDGYGFTDPSR